MAVDKNKVIAEATRFAQKGQWDKAIRAYDRILAEDPKDVRVLLKVGELHQKRGDPAAAAATFARVAEAYTDQGFFLKAIAVYKQMMKLSPDDLRVNERLANLYQQLGIMSDAMGQLQVVAQAAERAGDHAKLLEVLRRMTDVEPDNPGSAVKLGEIYARQGNAAGALEEFRRAGEVLKRNSRVDEWLRVAERISFLSPDDLPLTRELANSYLARGDTKRALSKLQLCFKADPKDLETLNLLAQAFGDLGQATKTISVYKELAHVYAERGQVQEGRAVWRRVAELAPDDPDAQAALQPSAAPAPAPRSPAAAPEPAARPAAPPPAPAPLRAAGPESIPKLLTETDVYVKYGLHQKALDHLRKVFEMDPEHLDAHEKARDIRAAFGDAAGAAEQGARAVRAALRRGAADRAAAAVARLRQIAPGYPELAALAAEAGVAAPDAVEEVLVEPAVELEPIPEILIEAAAPVGDDEVALAAAGEGEDERVAEEEDASAGLAAPLEEGGGPVLDDEPLVPPPPSAPAPIALAPPTPVARVELVPGPARRMRPPPVPPVARPTPAPMPPPAELRPTPPPVPPAARPTPAPMPLPAELRPTRPPVPPAARPTPAPMPLPAELRPTPPPMPPVARPTPAPMPPPAELRPTPPPMPPAASLDLSDELGEVDFYLEQGLLEEARETLGNLLSSCPDHPELRARLAEVERRAVAAPAPEPAPAPAPVAPADGAFDIGKELAAELGTEMPPPAEELQYSVEEVFSQFKKGVAQTVKAEDTDTHYDLGIAYKEMGLLDDALQEFETALRGATRRREIDCLSMVALCHMEKGDAAGAVQAWRRALRSDWLTPETARAVHYELALAYRAAGDAEAALWYMNKVVKADRAFRDAVAQLAAMGGGPGRAPPDADGGPAAAGPKKNIGYV